MEKRTWAVSAKVLNRLRPLLWRTDRSIDCCTTT
ncbi:hypothetical protein M5D96_011769 [Drosophila gunungcola]|uniref:Uncharacterized protein n=1 Tax=Drosophila gunungcola TaxID=103775 RepID=A0A9P9YED9_9MUSC|nr:hypothetical protein M5D96_011769 [Drosophila gunungcola]